MTPDTSHISLTFRDSYKTRTQEQSHFQLPKTQQDVGVAEVPTDNAVVTEDDAAGGGVDVRGVWRPTIVGIPR